MFCRGDSVRLKCEEVEIVSYGNYDFFLRDTKSEVTGRDSIPWPMNSHPFYLSEDNFPHGFFLDTILKRSLDYVSYHLRVERTPREDEMPWMLANDYFVVEKLPSFDQDGAYKQYPAERARTIQQHINQGKYELQYATAGTPAEHLLSACHNYVSSVWSGSIFKGKITKIFLEKPGKTRTWLDKASEFEILDWEDAGYTVKVMLYIGTELLSYDINLFKLDKK